MPNRKTRAPLATQGGALAQFIIDLQDESKLKAFASADSDRKREMLMKAGVTGRMAQDAVMNGDAPRIHIALTYDLVPAVHLIDSFIMQRLTGTDDDVTMAVALPPTHPKRPPTKKRSKTTKSTQGKRTS